MIRMDNIRLPKAMFSRQLTTSHRQANKTVQKFLEGHSQTVQHQPKHLGDSCKGHHGVGPATPVSHCLKVPHLGTAAEELASKNMTPSTPPSVQLMFVIFAVISVPQLSDWRHTYEVASAEPHLSTSTGYSTLILLTHTQTCKQTADYITSSTYLWRKW